MRHLVALAFLLAALGAGFAGTQALRAPDTGPGLLRFIFAPGPVFDRSICG